MGGPCPPGYRSEVSGSHAAISAPSGAVRARFGVDAALADWPPLCHAELRGVASELMLMPVDHRALCWSAFMTLRLLLRRRSRIRASAFTPLAAIASPDFERPVASSMPEGFIRCCLEGAEQRPMIASIAATASCPASEPRCPAASQRLRCREEGDAVIAAP